MAGRSIGCDPSRALVATRTVAPILRHCTTAQLTDPTTVVINAIRASAAPLIR